MNINRRSAILSILAGLFSFWVKPHAKASYETALATLKPVEKSKLWAPVHGHFFRQRNFNSEMVLTIVESWNGTIKKEELETTYENIKSFFMSNNGFKVLRTNVTVNPIAKTGYLEVTHTRVMEEWKG